ncbi:MAG: hypothetical protein WDN46_13500 [Methylocella sp.]
MNKPNAGAADSIEIHGADRGVFARRAVDRPGAAPRDWLRRVAAQLSTRSGADLASVEVAQSLTAVARPRAETAAADAVASDMQRDAEWETYAELSHKLDELELRLRRDADDDSSRFLKEALKELEAKLQISVRHRAPAAAGRAPAFVNADQSPANRDAPGPDLPLQNAPATIGRLEREIRAIGGKLETLRSPLVDGAAFAQMQKQTEEIRDLLTDIAARPLSTGKLEAQLDDLTRKAEEAIANTAQPRDYDALSQNIEAAHRRLTAKFEAGLAATSAETGGIKDLVQTLAEKIDAVRDPKASDPAIEALQLEMTKIAKRLDGAEAGFASLTSLEQLIASLFQQLEDSRGAGGAKAGRDLYPDAGANRHDLGVRDDHRVTREIADLRAERDEADRRIHLALNAVQETVGKVAERLTKMEAGLGEMRPNNFGPLLASSLAPIFAPRVERPQNDGWQNGSPHSDALNGRAGEAAPFRGGESFGPVSASQGLFDGPGPRQSEHGVETAAKANDSVDFLIEPGSGFSRRRDPAGARVFDERTTVAQERERGAGRADFIAAARRAAKAAKMEANASRAVAAAEDAGRQNGFFRAHKRPLILSVAALCLALGAYALAKAVSHGTVTAPSFTKLLGRSAERDTASTAGGVAVSTDPGPTPAAAATRRATPDSAPPAHPISDRRNSARQSLINSGLLDPSPVAPAPLAGPPDSSQPSETPATRAIAGSDPIIVGAIGRSAANWTNAASSAPALNAPLLAPALAAMAVEDLRNQADAGDAAAQFELGRRLADGRTGARDITLAAQYYAKAAEQGIAAAQYRLAVLTEKGLGVDRDPARAQALHLEAAEHGNARAMHNLGVLAADGVDEKPDYAAAAIWFSKAAAFGLRDSQFNLAILLERGLGLRQDYEQAYAWFSIAAAKGDAEAGRRRDDVALKLSAADLAMAKTVAEAFRPRPLDPAANETLILQPRPTAASPANDALSKPKVSGL